MTASNFGATPAGGVYEGKPHGSVAEEPEDLQIASSTFGFPLCPHCGGELSLLVQTKVYLGEGGPEETDHV